MPSDVWLESVELKMSTVSGFDVLSYASATLSNQMVSPEYHKRGVNHFTRRVKNFNSAKSVSAVYAEDGENFVIQIRFIEKRYKEAKFDLTERSGNKRKLSSNEELIGIYGVHGVEDWLTSFGFIVRVRNLP